MREATIQRSLSDIYTHFYLSSMFPYFNAKQELEVKIE